MRVATFNTELSRKGPGILLRDVLRGKDAQIKATIEALVQANADIVALQGFDYDFENAALRAFRDSLRGQGVDYPYIFSAPPNAGRQTLLDLDGDGKVGGPGDAQGYGRFFGQGSMALLSRYPIAVDGVQNFTDLLWRDLPDALLPRAANAAFPSEDAQAIQRLAAHGAWVVPIVHPDLGQISVLTYHATPPVFDGPEDANGRRNHDETRFWSLYLDGVFGPAPKKRFVLLGDANLDPYRGDGRRVAMQNLLNHPIFQDPLSGHPTVNWEQTGPMRVDYALPSKDWEVTGAGVIGPNTLASRHALVWADLKP